MDLNRVFLIGNLTRDPESKEIANGQKVVKFGLATNRIFKSGGNKKEEVVFHNVIAWGKLGEIVEKYLKKGSRVYLEGRVNNRKYEDKGVTKYYSEVVARELLMLGSTNGSKSKQSKEKVIEETVEEEEVDLEKIPF